jgi:hypothetical protein
MLKTKFQVGPVVLANICMLKTKFQVGPVVLANIFLCGLGMTDMNNDWVQFLGPLLWSSKMMNKIFENTC